ncbi:MAG: PD-(D/E)XK nuclease family protein [Ilumatobacteraceae bacterium]
MTTESPTLSSLNPMQQAVLDSLGKSADWQPLPIAVIENIRAQLHDELQSTADKITPESPIWVTKHKLTTVHGCEANHMAALTSFEWTIANVKGTVLHKAVELGRNWRGEIIPSDVVDEALAQLADDERGSAGPFIEQLTPAERAQLRSSSVDLFTKFDECFPPLKPAWRPVLESSARYEMFDRRINLSTRADLTLGSPGAKVIIDLKSGRFVPSHREELRFYALVEAMRSGQAPRRLATYSLVTARTDVEEVTEGVLQAATRKTIDGIRLIVELERDGREPRVRPGSPCYWCPLMDDCAEGIAYKTRREDPDADDE